MPKAVRFDEYGGVDVLHVADVERPEPGGGQVLVRVKAAGINPGEIAIREGLLHDRWPATFPSGQGSDFAGVVEATGPGVEAFAIGDEVLGSTERRASQAQYVVAEASQLMEKPRGISWEVAGSLHVVGATAWAAIRAVDPQPGETVVVSGAAGGVGSLAVQLAKRTGATAIGLASAPNHDWLRAHGIVPVAYAGDDLADRIRAAAALAPDGRVDAFVDTFGGGYVDLAIDELGVAPARVDTIIDWEAAGRRGAKTDGSAAGAQPAVLAELVELIAAGEMELPIARTYPLERVRDAYRELAERHTRGKIVLLP